MNTKPFPVWGPYGKKYMGYSRIMDSSIMPGVRFDVCTAPALRGSRAVVPNVTVPSGCHPWDCSEDYSFVQYRQELSGKDVYADILYVRDGENIRIRTVLTNRSERTEDCLVNYFLSLEYPAAYRTAVDLPEKSDDLPALQYDRFAYAIPHPWDHQNPDGLRKGEIIAAEFVDGAGLGDNAPASVFPPFGATAGDLAAYTVPLRHSYSRPVLTIRYRSVQNKDGVQKPETDTRFRINGIPVVFPYASELSLLSIPLVNLTPAMSDAVRLEFVSEGGNGIEFDFLCVTEQEDVSGIRIRRILPEYEPVYEYSEAADDHNAVLLSFRYPGTEGCFSFRSFGHAARLRTVDSGCLEDCVPARLSNPDPSFDKLRASFSRSFRDKHSDDGFFLNPLVHSILVKPHETVAVDAILTYHQDTAESMYTVPALPAGIPAEAPRLSYPGEGARYELSQSLLRAALLTNIVYPIRKHGSLILHHTPGKRWDSLYTWDSGFIGLGMTSICRSYAEYSLDTYLSDENNPDYAFLHHGSVVPTQFFLFSELLDRTSGTDHAEILSLYPRLRLYYRFLMGKTHGSATSPFASGLLTTYDYWYSSSGMDDYPAQAAMHRLGLRSRTAPVVSSVMTIRCARILLKALEDPVFAQLPEAAAYLADRDGYLQDIDRLDKALNRYSWDPDAGYYSYVVHSDNKEPIAILRTESGENYNKGTEGVIPLLAGICSPEQEERLLAHLQDPAEMLTPYGITTVDRTASYYRNDGYWNGSVWFPYQWLLWRTMLDLGQAGFAWEIAHRALESWKSEVDATHYTFEMLSAETGRGGWFHNFGGLSAPLLLWADAYYRPGTVTVGFDTAIYAQTGDSCTLRHFGPKRPVTVLFCPETASAAACSYRVTLNDTVIPYRLRGSAVEITYLPADDQQLLRVTPSGD